MVTCKDCRHYRPAGDDGVGRAWDAWCSLTKRVERDYSLVDGYSFRSSASTCESERSDQGDCTPYGRNFVRADWMDRVLRRLS